MTSSEALVFGEQWAHHWNTRDIEAVLAHFAERAVFTSPVALKVTGKTTIHGKEAIRAYWVRALANLPSLRFTINRVLWDADHSELAIIYDREIDGRHERGAEVLTFDPEGRVVRGEAFYGVIPGPR
jgi:ketosteroid isomerase-like protein